MRCFPGRTKLFVKPGCLECANAICDECDSEFNDRRFRRQLRLLGILRAFYVVACGLSIGVFLGALLVFFTKGHS